MNLSERVQHLAALHTPHLPKPQIVCSMVYETTLPDGTHRFRCSECGAVQIVDQLIGGTQTRSCPQL
jgi:hypothetical protein